MKIALVGYGKMGKTIEQIALSRGHEIVSIIDINNPDDFESAAFKSADVAIEFTTPATAFDNYMKCFAANVPVVSGTTGWTARMSEIKEMCEKEGKTFFYASNFSIGVNIFFALNKYLAKVMNNFPSYDVRMTEVHHIHKLDAPSGTAITLAEGILEGGEGDGFADSCHPRRRGPRNPRNHLRIGRGYYQHQARCEEPGGICLGRGGGSRIYSREEGIPGYERFVPLLNRER